MLEVESRLTGFGGPNNATGHCGIDAGVTVAPDRVAGMSSVLYGYELLLLRKLQSEPALIDLWREKLMSKATDDSYDLGEIPHSLWFLAVTLDKKKERFLRFMRDQVPTNVRLISSSRESLLGRYLSYHSFTELHLDGIFKYGDDNTLPLEIFRCRSVRWLSLQYNYLDRIPCDIGRMSNLEYLALTNNKLQNKSLPYSLTFCTRLRTIMLDNNLLDALPGFLLKMASLDTVHRHGNHNYFKSTFMWYHTDVNERILAVQSAGGAVPDFLGRDPESLQFWAAKSIIGSKINFFADPRVAPVLRDYIAEVYRLFSVCGYCNSAKLITQSGFKVITFKNPYLGNTCVPFQHWACSLVCATALEIPAREEQISAARDLDRAYDSYVRECQRLYEAGGGGGGGCGGGRSRRGISLRRGARGDGKGGSMGPESLSYISMESSVGGGSFGGGGEMRALHRGRGGGEEDEGEGVEHVGRTVSSFICCCMRPRRQTNCQRCTTAV